MIGKTIGTIIIKMKIKVEQKINIKIKNITIYNIKKKIIIAD